MHIGTHSDSQRMLKTCARLSKTKTQHGEKSDLEVSPLNKEILYWKLIAVGEDGELILSKSAAPCQLIMLQWKVIYPQTYKQHKLGLMSDGHISKNLLY